MRFLNRAYSVAHYHTRILFEHGEILVASSMLNKCSSQTLDSVPRTAAAIAAPRTSACTRVATVQVFASREGVSWLSTGTPRFTGSRYACSSSHSKHAHDLVDLRGRDVSPNLLGDTWVGDPAKPPSGRLPCSRSAVPRFHRVRCQWCTPGQGCLLRLSPRRSRPRPCSPDIPTAVASGYLEAAPYRIHIRAPEDVPHSQSSEQV
jgi:hypothetical protein